jgi:uncharacterized protein YkwD
MITLPNGYRFEAEALSLSGYRIESSSTAGASSGKFIATRHTSSATGKASGTFTGDAGTYRVEVGYYDENDGQSLATVTVDGQATTFRFDDNLGSSLPAPNTHATHVTHQSIALQKGDSFSLSGQANGSEYARFDYIDFIRLDAPNPPPPPPGGTPGLEAFEAEVVRLVNEFRVQNGRKTLTVDAALSQAAEEHSEDMAWHDFFSHTGSDGTRVGARVSEEGYDWRAVGENIAAGQSTPQAVVNAWKASSGHRANMLGSWEDIGVGYEYLANDTGRVNYHHYWTMDFGTPSDALLA